ncbi:ribose 5-phosphate isomerase B [Mediterraneibacter massiliensis]|uniref:ribose 5-phosphate isomerase B n=1 Tax=Mediterraneibacter massiliensis TaxID=1720300 RepID=UPI0024ACA157|nr:ribose 5-phosphate isomerase B [Mediterraneibacter massiliensis]
MIALGSDHGGYELKEEIKKYLEAQGIAVKDFGSFTPEAVDYADVAYEVALSVAQEECEKGILCCGTGIGISIAANKVQGIRAACCSDCFSAKMTRMHNDANILCMGGRVVGAGLALMMTDLFLTTPFEGGRHQRRIDKIAKIEKEEGRKIIWR